MLITKFNRMIRNRVVWWIIGGAVIVTFVGWFSPRGGCEPVAPAGMIARFDGKPVTEEEFRRAKTDVYLMLVTIVGRPISLTPEMNRTIEAQAWRRLAALRVARQLGLEATERETLAAIQRDPRFAADNGVFSRERYIGYVRGVLPRLGATDALFHEHIRNTLSLQKLQAMLGAAAWVSPFELTDALGRYADSFRVKYLVLDTHTLSRAVAVGDADARAFYAAHTNRFVVPPQVSVRWVAFPVSNYLERAIVGESEIGVYYDEHPEDYTRPDTNGQQAVRPLDEVRGEISNRLVRQSALLAARDAATDLAVALAPGRDGEAVPFERVAAGLGLVVHTTGLFAAGGEVHGLDVPPAFNRAAFELRPTPDEYFSDAVAASNAVYVLALLTNVDAYLPPFESVATQALQWATIEAREEALRDEASRLREALQTALNAGRPMESVLQPRGLNVATSGLFSAFSAPASLEDENVLQAISGLNAGELTEPVATTNGFLIAQVQERVPAGSDEAEAVRNQVLMNLSRYRARALFSDWQESLTRTNRLHKLVPAVVPEAPADDAQEE